MHSIRNIGKIDSVSVRVFSERQSRPKSCQLDVCVSSKRKRKLRHYGGKNCYQA